MIIKACNDFRSAIESVPKDPRAEMKGDFIVDLEAARAGDKPNNFGFTIWLAKYSPPYLPAAVPDALRTPLVAFSDQAKKVADSATPGRLPVLTAQEAKSLVDAYSDAATQCERAGAPLATS